MVNGLFGAGLGLDFIINANWFKINKIQYIAHDRVLRKAVF
jgi:hypothetical protein